MPDTSPCLAPLHADLIKALQQKTLLPIAAAGVSMSVLDSEQQPIFPSWKELLQRAASQLSESDEQSKKLANGIMSALDLDGYQQAANYARKGFMGGSWSDFFDQHFDLDLSKADLALPEAIWALSNSCITLNYDMVMEKSSPNKINVYDNQSEMELCKFAQRGNKSAELWHLHGRLSNKKDIIFTSESYDDLYKINQDAAKNYKAALTRLQNLASTQHFLFIGCSMDDAELLAQLAEQNKIFGDGTGPHFVMVRASDQTTLEAKLAGSGVNFIFIPFENFGQPLLNKVRQISQYLPAIDIPIPVLTAVPEKSERCKIAILSPQMLDHQLDFSTALTELKKLKADLYFYPLNQQRLNDLDAMDYIILLSNTALDGILIEDEYLCRQRMALDEVMDNIGCSKHKAVLLFTDKALPAAAAVANIDQALMIVPTFEKKVLTKFTFQFFNKHKNAFDFFPNLQLCHERDFQLTQLPSRNKTKLVDCATTPPKDINPSLLQDTVGRLDDIESIVRKTIKLTATPGGCLTIKGAGGLGKTTLAKKAVIALARDGRYPQGIYFIDASAMADFAEFEYKIMQPFGLEGVQQAITQLALRHAKQHSMPQGPSEQRLIILDNAETLKHLSDSRDIMRLLGDICQHCTLVATSRELLGVEYGDAHELRQFTTDEAETLFVQQSHFKKINDSDRRLLRQDVLEDLLDNHPLAVKLIAKAVVKGNNLTQLRDALLKNNEFFDNTDLGIFNHAGDDNIERQKSIFNCIAYSYEQLGRDEKSVFKMLALFPDGLPSEQLKHISSDKKLNDKNESYQSIKDQHIKALQNKSLIEEHNGVQKLHAIVRRFAQEKIKQDENAAVLYRKAFKHNVALATSLTNQFSNNFNNPGLVFARASAIQNNLISTIGYFGQYAYKVEKQLDYIRYLSTILQGCNCRGQLKLALQGLPQGFSQQKEDQKFIDMKVLWLDYYDGQFARVYKQLQSSFILEDLLELDFSNLNNREMATNAAGIYEMEGDVVASLNIYLKDYEAGGATTNHYPDALFLLGQFDPSLLHLADPGFGFFDQQFILGSLDINQLQRHFNALYEKDHIERMQCYYILAKAGKSDVEILDSLLVVNPYTAGLKQLMLAWQENQPDKAEGYYQQALIDLFHIKYYYVEALLYYCRFLKAQADSQYTEQLTLGLNLAKKHYYRFLQHQFIQLEAGTNEIYDSNLYPLPDDLPLDDFKRLTLRDFKKNRQ